MDPSTEDLRQMTGTIWSTVLGLELEEWPGEDPKEEGITGCIHITGAWEGVILVFVAGNLGRTLAAAMFAMEPEEVGDEEVTDALCEIANIVGGNIKVLLPQPSLLSLPSTIFGMRSSQHFPRTRTLCGVNLQCQGAQVTVFVLKKVEAEPIHPAPAH